MKALRSIVTQATRLRLYVYVLTAVCVVALGVGIAGLSLSLLRQPADLPLSIKTINSIPPQANDFGLLGGDGVNVIAESNALMFNVSIVGGNNISVTVLSNRTLSIDWTGVSGGGGGGVTLVDLVVPTDVFLVTSSAVTTSGSLTFEAVPQAANHAWLGPISGTQGPPSFRALVSADIPDALSLSMLGVSGATMLGTNTTCVAPLMPSCYDISNQACLSGTLASNCIPSVLHITTLTVDYLTVLNGSSVSVDYANSSFFGSVSVNGTLACTGAGMIDNGCLNLGGYTCPVGVPLADSCIPASLIFYDASVTNNLTVNTVTCAGGALPGTCIPDRVATINGIAPNALDFSILAGTGTSVVAAVNGVTISNTGVTSVGLALPASVFSVGSAVTTTGTLTGSFATQTANTIFAGPSSGIAAVPTFRTQVLADLPQLTDGQLYVGSTGSSVVAATPTGTTNQISVTVGTGSFTLSTPQNIHTAATPTFASETLTAVTNQLTLGTTNTVTISSTAPSASRVYTLHDAGAAANFVLGTAGALTITNVASVGDVLTLTGTTTASWQTPSGASAVVLDSGASPTYPTAPQTQGIWYGQAAKAGAATSTSIVLGNSGTAAAGGVAIGSPATASGTSSVVIGLSATSNSIASSVSIGPSATITDTAHALGFGINTASVLPGTLGVTVNGASYQWQQYTSTFAKTVTSGVTTTLTVTSAQIQYFTGSSTQNVRLPVVTTLSNGFFFKIINLSDLSVTVMSSSFAPVIVLPPRGGWGTFTCIDTAGGTGTSSWSVEFGVGQASAGTSIAIGNGAVAFQTNAVAMGPSASASGTNAVAIGNMASATSGVSIGLSATSGSTAIAIGPSAVASTLNTIAIGNSATTNSIAGSISIGLSSTVTDTAHALGLAINTASVLPGTIGVTINGVPYQWKQHTSWYATTATAAGTTTLTVTSAQTQYFTGSTTQTVVLPVASTLANGFFFKIVNSATGLVTVQTSGTATVVILPTNGGWATFTCVNTAGGTGIASWSVESGVAQSNDGSRVGIGSSANAGAIGATAVGPSTTASGSGSLAIGSSVIASATASSAIGNGAVTNSVANTMIFVSNAAEQMRLLDSSVGGYTFRLVKSTQAGSSPQTLSAAQALGGYHEVTTDGAFTLNLDTGANLDANAQLAGNLYVGLSFRCTVVGTGTGTVITLVGASGSTLKGIATGATNAAVELLFYRTGSAAWDIVATHG